jgi:acyl dehydratase
MEGARSRNDSRPALATSRRDREIRSLQCGPIPECPRMTAPQFTVPINERYFEDYVPGPTYEYGPISVSEAEIIDFAKKFDPQYIHADPEKAARGPFGGLISSGWHTSSLMMRLYADNYVSSVAAIASPGVDELRWLKPVRPGDSLWIRVTVLESRRSQSKPHFGMVRVLIEVINQNKETVMTVKTMNLIRCRTDSQ